MLVPCTPDPDRLRAWRRVIVEVPEGWSLTSDLTEGEHGDVADRHVRVVDPWQQGRYGIGAEFDQRPGFALEHRTRDRSAPSGARSPSHRRSPAWRAPAGPARAARILHRPLPSSVLLRSADWAWWRRGSCPNMLQRPLRTCTRTRRRTRARAHPSFLGTLAYVRSCLPLIVAVCGPRRAITLFPLEVSIIICSAVNE